MKAVFLLLIGLLCAAPAFGFGTGAEGCSGDCTACHKVTLNEVKEIFKKLDQGVSVEEISPAPARGLYQITLKKDAQVSIVYMDFSKNFLLGGPLIDIGMKKDLTQQKLEDTYLINPMDIPLEHALIMGNPKGKKSMYLFSDPECPFCSKLHQTLIGLVKEDPELKVYLLLIPLDIHPDSLWKTETIVCASRDDMGKALGMLSDSYDNKKVPRLECGKGIGGEMQKIGKKLGIEVTPTLSFANGRALRGAKSKDEIRAMLDSVK